MDLQEQWWQAVQGRDRQADGQFFYGVSTTKIYCRPSCPSRRPQRNNVTFFTTPQQAEEAGYRPCLRCRPLGEEPQIELVRQACACIENRLEETLTLEALAAEIGSSPFHLQKVFKKIMGVSPRQYAEACRMRQFKAALRQGEAIGEALYGAGYGSSSRLYERAPAQLGMTPQAYRQGGAGVEITYAIRPCPLGYLLLAATSKGICAASLGDDEAALSGSLAAEFPRAALSRDDDALGEWVDAVLGYLEGRALDLSLPLVVSGSPFQVRIWEALRRIPAGETRSYSQVAREVGQPTAARAVARACASNHIALLIPCHRVVRENGEFSGYRWGVERKKALLEMERKAAASPAEALTGR